MTKLRQNEPGLREVRSILREWLDQAASALGEKRVGDASIHRARKLLKKTRAALRLVRDALTDVSYERSNIALRDAARPLGAARDSRVLTATLDALREEAFTTSEMRKIDKFRRLLRSNEREAKHGLTLASVARLRRMVREVISESDGWRLPEDAWPILEVGLVRVYRSGRKSMRAAQRSRETPSLHEWRKQVKYLWHQLQILQPLRPGALGKLADQCHKLADSLGDDHDLAVLREKIEADASLVDADLTEILLTVLDRNRTRLQNKAIVLGDRIFEETPKQFGKRMGKYWQTFQTSG